MGSLLKPQSPAPFCPSSCLRIQHSRPPPPPAPSRGPSEEAARSLCAPRPQGGHRSLPGAPSPAQPSVSPDCPQQHPPQHCPELPSHPQSSSPPWPMAQAAPCQRVKQLPPFHILGVSKSLGVFSALPREQRHGGRPVSSPKSLHVHQGAAAWALDFRPFSLLNDHAEWCCPIKNTLSSIPPPPRRLPSRTPPPPWRQKRHAASRAPQTRRRSACWPPSEALKSRIQRAGPGQQERSFGRGLGFEELVLEEPSLKCPCRVLITRHVGRVTSLGRTVSYRNLSPPYKEQEQVRMCDDDAPTTAAAAVALDAHRAVNSGGQPQISLRSVHSPTHVLKNLLKTSSRTITLLYQPKLLLYRNIM